MLTATDILAAEIAAAATKAYAAAEARNEVIHAAAIANHVHGACYDVRAERAHQDAADIETAARIAAEKAIRLTTMTL